MIARHHLGLPGRETISPPGTKQRRRRDRTAPPPPPGSDRRRSPVSEPHRNARPCVQPCEGRGRATDNDTLIAGWLHAPAEPSGPRGGSTPPNPMTDPSMVRPLWKSMPWRVGRGARPNVRPARPAPAAGRELCRAASGSTTRIIAVRSSRHPRHRSRTSGSPMDRRLAGTRRSRNPGPDWEALPKAGRMIMGLRRRGSGMGGREMKATARPERR